MVGRFLRFNFKCRSYLKLWTFKKLYSIYLGSTHLKKIRSSQYTRGVLSGEFLAKLGRKPLSNCEFGIEEKMKIHVWLDPNAPVRFVETFEARSPLFL